VEGLQATRGHKGSRESSVMARRTEAGVAGNFLPHGGIRMSGQMLQQFRWGFRVLSQDAGRQVVIRVAEFGASVFSHQKPLKGSDK
jgi:hypothetical protein